MPDIIRNGVTLKAALQEAATVALLSRPMLYAYELWHESFTEPIRFVNDTVALLATLEAGAPRDALTEVEFLACPLRRSPPEESDSAANPTVTLGRPDVSGLLKNALDNARGSQEPWTLIERLYAGDISSGPAQLPPLTFELSAVDIAGAAASISAGYGDHLDRAIPRLTFRREEYPGLGR